MMDKPTIREMIEAVRDFVENKAIPELKGHTAFHARVAVNALSIAMRELDGGAVLDAKERVGLMALLGQSGKTEELNRLLCARIRAGDIGIDTPGLITHLEATTRGKLAVDQPNYSGLKAGLKG